MSLYLPIGLFFASGVEEVPIVPQLVAIRTPADRIAAPYPAEFAASTITCMNNDRVTASGMVNTAVNNAVELLYSTQCFLGDRF